MNSLTLAGLRPARGPLAAALLLTAGLLAGCAPLLVGGAVAGGAMLATDRRSSQTMLDDQQIEQRAGILIYQAYGSAAHVNVTSFDGRVLLTGELPLAADQARVADMVRGVDKVRQVHDETVLAPPSGFATRSNDTWITSKVKSALLGASGVSANDVKVVTERATVYLMGRLTAREADMATEVARTTVGVQRVVRLFDLAPPLDAPAPASAASAASDATAPAAAAAPAASSPLR